MDVEAISNCIGPLSRDYLERFPHHATPCTTLQRLLPFKDQMGNSSSLHFKSFPYTWTLPQPLTPLSNLTTRALNGIDPTTNLIREKMKWLMKKEKIVSAVRRDKKNISGKAIKRAVRTPVDSKAVVPRGVVLLAQHLDTDPDPFFSGACNWYYTGGTLATISHDQDHYLIHASQSKLSYTRVGEGALIEPSSTVNLYRNDPIYQIVTNSRGVAVRQSSRIHILSVSETEDNKMSLCKVHSASQKQNPFLSVALPGDSLRKYCTISNNGILKLWDVEYAKRYKGMLHVQPGDGVAVTDSWSRLQYVDNRTLLLADRCCLHLLDTRAGMKEKQQAWCPKKIVEQCEELSYVERSSRRDNVVYVITSHHALCLDLRFGFCQRWTHMMAAPPSMGFTRLMSDDQELLCLGSQVLSDCVAIVNSWTGEEPHSQYSPSGLPSPAKGLHVARQQGLCLDPSLIQRCTQSMTGLSWLPGGPDALLSVVRQSATADVFTQQLVSQLQDYKQLSDRGLRAYEDWCKPAMCLQRTPAMIAVTEVKDFTPLLQALTDPCLPLKKPTEDYNGANTTEVWQLSKKYVEDCVDLLAGKMLAVWDVAEEDEWVTQVEEESFIEQDPAEKVMNWLDAANSVNATADLRNETDMSKLKPTTTSTPYPLHIGNEEATDKELSPWLTKASQATPTKKRREQFSSPLSLSQSQDLERQPWKKQKLFDLEDTIVCTTPIQTTEVKKPVSSAKKKFIPGF